MAVAELNVSRREVLGAACAAPLLGVAEGVARHPELVSGSMLPPTRPSSVWTLKQVQGDEESVREAQWGRALARFRAVEAALAAAEGAEDEVFDPLVGRFNRVLTLLLRASAPDVGALAVKLDLLVTHQAWELDFAEPCLAALRRDALRLPDARVAGVGGSETNGDSYVTVTL